MHFHEWNVRISINLSSKFVPEGLINNIPSLVQIMAWRRPDDKPLSETMMVNLLTHICVTRPQWVNGARPFKTKASMVLTRRLYIPFLIPLALDNFLNFFLLIWHHSPNWLKTSHMFTHSLGAGNYHQPQLPSANMADSDVGTERYSVFMQILSTYFGVWGLYTTEYHVCTFWTPPFDLRIATFAARWWRKNGGLMVIYNTVWW